MLALLVAVVLGGRAPAASAAVYWASAWDGTVSRANLDGSSVEPSFIQADSASAVAVDAAHLYWNGNVNLDPAVARANLNGSGVDANFVKGTGRLGVAVDSQHVYWAGLSGSTDGKIGRANLDGSGANQDFITGVPGPCGIAVDGTYIYWGNVNAGSIGRAKLDGTEVDLDFITPESGYSPCGVAVNQSHIFWADYWQGGTNIGRADLDGSDVDPDFISGGFYPCGVAVDDSHVYWANEHRNTGTIGRANLDGTNVNQDFVVLSEGTAHRPCGVAVDALRPSTTTIAASMSSIRYGQDVELTATVGGSGPTPTGDVQFELNGDELGAPVTRDPTGKARYTPAAPLDVGDTVAVAYSGDPQYVSSRSQKAALSIEPARTSTEIRVAPNPVISGDEVDVTVTVANLDSEVTPFGSIQFEIDGAPIGPPLALDAAGQVAIGLIADVPAGDYQVTASYHDDTAAIADFLGSGGSVLQRVIPVTAARPPSPPSPAGPTLTVVSRAQLVAMSALLIKALGARGFAALTEARQRFTASRAGTLSQRVYARRGRRAGSSAAKRVLIASGRRVFAAATGQR